MKDGAIEQMDSLVPPLGSIFVYVKLRSLFLSIGGACRGRCFEHPQDGGLRGAAGGGPFMAGRGTHPGDPCCQVTHPPVCHRWELLHGPPAAQCP